MQSLHRAERCPGPRGPLCPSAACCAGARPLPASANSCTRSRPAECPAGPAGRRPACPLLAALTCGSLPVRP
eukprot:4977306-Lingulodinium_polyedra.AAC.1